MTPTSVQCKKAGTCLNWTPEAGCMLTLSPIISQSGFHIPDFHSQPVELPIKKKCQGVSKDFKKWLQDLPYQDNKGISHTKKEEAAPASCTQTPQFLHPFLHPSLNPQTDSKAERRAGDGPRLEADSQAVQPWTPLFCPEGRNGP